MMPEGVAHSVLNIGFGLGIVSCLSEVRCSEGNDDACTHRLALRH